MQMDLARQLEQLSKEMDKQLMADLQVRLVPCVQSTSAQLSEKKNFTL